MKFRRWAMFAVLLLLVTVTGIGVIVTRDSSSPAPATANHAAPLVDESSLKAARQLATLAVTADEERFAQEAARLADHEVDLAFADALRDATEHPVQIDPVLRQRIQRVQATITDEQSHLDQLRTRIASAKPGQKDDLQEQIDLLGAQKALDEDQLEDARQDLIRAGGDPEGTLQRLREEHEAGEHAEGAPKDVASSPPAALEAGSLAGQIRTAFWLKNKRGKLEAGQRDAENRGSALASEHTSLEQHVEQEQSQKEETRQKVAGVGEDVASGTGSKQATAAAVGSLQHFSDDQKSLSDLDKRILDEKELAAAYGGWIDLVRTQERGVEHNALQSVLWILLIALVVFTGGQLSDRYFGRSKLRQKAFRLRTALKFAMQAVGALLIVFVIVGIPNDVTTVLGLAGAGLTVALKDFIVGFLGWFVLMGRNGVHVGDWVEINGVVGEVIEVGLLRTVLMETGNWTDSGHPTGRKVAFVNSFAIEGHFFNFSTAGQWLWDELQFVVPPGQNPYPLVDVIQKVVEAESRADAALAEQEWRHSAGHHRLHSLSVTPAIQLRPTAAGVEIQVRYITSAHERYATRSRLYEKIVGILQAGPATSPLLSQQA